MPTTVDDTNIIPQFIDVDSLIKSINGKYNTAMILSAEILKTMGVLSEMNADDIIKLVFDSNNFVNTVINKNN